MNPRHKPARSIVGRLRRWAELARRTLRSPDRAVRSALGRIRETSPGRPAHLAHRVEQLRRQHEELLGQRLDSLQFDRPETPLVSIVIPVFNQLAATVACLDSIAEHGADVPFEVIVADDGSTDPAVRALTRIEGLGLVRNVVNRGFVHTCNRAAGAARGQILVFLNNDTLVTAGWMDALHRTFDTFPKVGLVGGKLVFPEGRLQEAGGIVWRDGSAWNYGRGADPDAPEVNYARRVDYCSAACLMIRAELFATLGGFDDVYAPAYYEDTDLAFRVRRAGFEVYYQPTCRVVHDEGTTAGSHGSRGVKRHQAMNRERFYRRWKDVLRAHGANGSDPESEKERHVRRRLLLVAERLPSIGDADRSEETAGRLATVGDGDVKVTVVPEHLDGEPSRVRELQARGFEVVHRPFVSSVVDCMRARGHEVDLVFFAGIGPASRVVSAAWQLCPSASIALDSEERLGPTFYAAIEKLARVHR